jgi:serine protease AprX
MSRGTLHTLVLCLLVAAPAAPAGHDADRKLDAAVLQRAHSPVGASRVIVRTHDGAPATIRIRALGGVPGRELTGIGGQVATVPDAALHQLAALQEIAQVSLDRPVQGTMDATAGAIGARWVAEQLGFDGKGVGVALIDSGVTAWHDDLDSDRVVHFADFVNYRPTHYDDYGHGSHVAGIIAGNGKASGGETKGIAPKANLIVLKALDGAGGGFTSNVLAAIDYAIAQRETYNIRIINLSVSAGVYESYLKDPLTLAAKRAVDAGIVVVAAAGNLGRSPLGQAQRGGISAPGNAPWVLTAGATTHNGTVDRSDDRVARFSSRGPSAIDRVAKPDLVAPGVGITSLAEPSSVLFAANPQARVRGIVQTISEPYLTLSGTSMAAPVVAGTVALMLQANPSLTPNAVKAILQFTAEQRQEYDGNAQGAGFLNARGAVGLAKAFGSAAPDATSEAVADPVKWSRQIIWGDRRVTAAALAPSANAWRQGVVWGARRTPSGETVSWTMDCAGDDCGGKELPAAAASDVVDWNAAFGDGELVMAGSVSDAPRPVIRRRR